MEPKITVFGNQHLNIGHAIASDLALCGHKVTLFDLPEFEESLEAVREKGGIRVTGDIRNLVAAKTGFARFDRITTDAEEALKDADVLFVDVPADEFETRLEPIAPYIKDGAILHFNYYGYWPSLRVDGILRRSGKDRVMITECPSTLYYARGSQGELDYHVLKPDLPLSVFPGNRRHEAFKVMQGLYPVFHLAKNILETNFENQNMLWHPAIALLNVADFDRAGARGDQTVHFYNTGITPHTGILALAQDKEREAVCRAYGTTYTPFEELIRRYVGGRGETIAEAQLSSNFIQNRPAYPPGVWQEWSRWDMPFALVPFVELAELAGAPVPLHRSLVNLFGALLGTDFWETGLTLQKIGLGGLSPEEVVTYVMEGKPPIA